MTGRDEEQGRRWRLVTQDGAPHYRTGVGADSTTLSLQAMEGHINALEGHTAHLESALAKAEQERDEAVEERDRWFQQYMELALDSGDLEALKGKAALADEMAKAIHWAGRATGGVPLGMRGWLNTYEALSTEPSASREDQG